MHLAIASATAEGPIPPKTYANPDEAIKIGLEQQRNQTKDAETFSSRRGRKSKVVEKFTISFEQYCFNHEKQNVAFVSSDNTSSTNETVNTANDVSAASSQGQVSSSTYADDVMFSFFANQSNSPQLDNKDLEQIDTNDIEEMDLKWQVAMLNMRVKRFIKKTGRNLNFNGKETVGFDRTKIECYNCHMRGHFTRECRAPRNQGNRNRDNTRRVVPVETPANALVVQDGIENASKEKDDLKLKLEKFEESSKNLTKLINSQISAKDKTGLGYDTQMKESEVIHSVFNNRDSDEDDNPVNDIFKTGEGFHAVPPPFTGNFKPSKADLSFARLDDFVYNSKVSKTITSKDSLKKPKTVRPSAPIIEDWESDSDDDCVIRPTADKAKPKFTKINFIKSGENMKFVNKENTYRQAAYPRKVQSSRSNRRNLNEMMTQKLGNGFEFIKKACFVCGSLNHLIKDCNFYENKMEGKSVLNNEGKVTGQREIRPVWNNAQRVNHQNKFIHPHPKRNFVPAAVLTKSGQVPVNTAKQSFPRATISISTARYVNTAATRPTVNGAKRSSNVFHKSHSPVRRTFTQKAALKNSDLKVKVNTARVNNVTTAGLKVVVSAAKGNRNNAIKSSACLVIFGWVCFLANKNETPEILKSFITGIENQIDFKVKAIRCNNGTEFKNMIMNEFCEMKGIRREFSVARTPQQNGVAERKNRTLIEAAKTMLADSKLPTTFWVEAVNTACYV
ncbi:ribonuclease H-like domain-containing protein [Tanacetum coccineum]